MRKNSDESITIVIILLIVCFVLVSGVISYGIYTCTGGSWKFGDWKFDTCFKSPDNTPAPAPAPASDSAPPSDPRMVGQYERANNPLDFFNIPEVSGTPHKPELYDMAKHGKCHPTYVDTFATWFDNSTESGDILDEEQKKAMENAYKIGNADNSGNWSTESNNGRIIGDTETFRVDYETDDPTLIEKGINKTPESGDWEFEYVRLRSSPHGFLPKDNVVFRSKKPIAFKNGNRLNNWYHLYFNPWTSHFTLGEYPENIDPSILAHNVYIGNKKNQSNIKVGEDGYIFYNIHGNLDDTHSYWNTEKTPAEKIKTFKFKVSLREGQTITKSDVDVLHNFHNTLKNVCSKYDNTGDGIGGDGARPINDEWGKGGESECKKVTANHPDLAGIPLSKEPQKISKKQHDRYSDNNGFDPNKIWDPYNGETDLCRFEPVGKCFPLVYDGGETSFSYNPYDQVKSFDLVDYEYLSGADINGVVDDKIRVDTHNVCTSIDNKRECDTRTSVQKHHKGMIIQRGEKICRWWSGFKAFVKPTVRYDDGLATCIEGDEYWKMKGSCTVDPSYTTQENTNICPEGTVTRKVCAEADNLPGDAKKCNFQVQTGYPRKDNAPPGSDEQGDYVHCGVCKPKALYSRGGGKKNYDNVDEVVRQGVYGTGNEVNPYTEKDCNDLLKTASTFNDSVFTIDVKNNKLKGTKRANVDQYIKDLITIGDETNLNVNGYFLGCKWDGDKDADKICREFTDNKGECDAHKHRSYRDAQEGACQFASNKHCDGKWEYPDKDLNPDNNEEVPNTCGALYPGLRKMTYREINSARAGGNPCEKEMVGWVEQPYPDYDERSNIESIHYMTTVPVSPSNISVGLNTPLEYGHASLRNPKNNDFKYVPCDVDCVEKELFRRCEFKGDTEKDRNEAAQEPTKRINYCEGQVVKYLGIKTKAQGNNGKKCPHFSINESRTGYRFGADEDGSPIFYENVPVKTNDPCTMPITKDGGYAAPCAQSNCLANLEKIKEIQKEINEGENEIEIENDKNEKIIYNKNNHVSIKDLYELYNSQCMTIGMTRNNTQEERKLACTDVQKYCSTCGDGKVFLKDERVCRSYDDDCGDSSDGFYQVGVKFKTSHGYTANHNPPNFCKWIEAPTTDIHSTETAYNNSIETST